MDDLSVKPPQFRPRQKDIAKALNVSQACVAIALNPKSSGKLPIETVALIEAKAREMKYRPQAQARILRSGRSHTIGVVFQSSRYHAPQEQMMNLALCTLKRGYQLISIDMKWYEDSPEKAQDSLLRVAAEGIIFCNVSIEGVAGWQEFAKECSIPIMTMSTGLSEDVDQVWPDTRSAYRDMTLHHIDQGSRSLHLLLPFHDAIPQGGQSAFSIVERVKGFTEAIRSRGGEVIVDEENGHVFDLPTKFSSRRPVIEGRVQYPLRRKLFADVYDVGYHEALRLLRMKTGRPDSIVCSNDHIATGVLAACNELNVSVPGEVCVSGADNVPFSRYCNVPLSTIEQPAESLAEWSIQRMVELIENPAEREVHKKEVFPNKLIFRKSTMRLPADEAELL